MAVEGFLQIGPRQRWMRRAPLCAMFAPTCRGAQCAPVATDPYRTRLHVKKRILPFAFLREEGGPLAVEGARVYENFISRHIATALPVGEPFIIP